MANIEFGRHDVMLQRLAAQRGNIASADDLLEIAGIMRQLHALKGELVANAVSQDSDELEEQADRMVEKLMAVLGLQPSS